MGLKKIVVLGTGGTIAGLAAPHAADSRDYVAAQQPVGELLAGLPTPAGCTLLCEQVAQIDSKDMDLVVWQKLLQRCVHWLAQDDVQGLLITHGTDTLEETAFLLQTVLAPRKPVVLTCAMRPANAADTDGPQNLRDALAVAATAGAQGVLAVCAGRILGAQDVQKVHSSRLDAFSAGEAGDIGRVQQGRVDRQRDWPGPRVPQEMLLEVLLTASALPRVEIVLSHAAACGATVDALVDPAVATRYGAQPVRGLVLAGTGGGTVHHELEAALWRARGAGVRVLRSTRCVDGFLQPRPSDEFPVAPGLSPVKARLALMLELLR
ncbi:asparaginase [Rhodoferax sp. BAB1]|uniref:asparaginase n=1 Tax=Rhodoferax sp. BAB1 TaxID=2741720 RepID=UPI0020C688C9|nr:asparaginase [Rhodoferax sp. BAB1]